jgi:hypothetical protein
MRYTLLTLLILGLTAFPASAAVIINHVGSTDPATEGWTQSLAGAGGAESVVTVPEPALRIASGPFGGADDGFRRYIYTATASDFVAIDAAGGWVLTARVATPQVSQSFNYGALADFNDSTFAERRFVLQFGSDADGNARVRALNNTDSAGAGPEFTLAAGGFNTFRIEFSSAANSATLYANDQILLSNWIGVAPNALLVNQLRFGGTSQFQANRADYALVELATIPEPGSAFLLLCGISLLALARRRKRV